MRSLQAAAFSVGAPLGWLLIRFLEGADISQDIQNNILLYAYLLFGTLIVFTLFGAYVGSKEKYITDLAVKDPLTQIYNRRFFIDRLTEEISRASRYQKPLSMIYFDLDHFKIVNDTYGHPAGDKVLVKVATEVKESIRSHDVFARTGGEEFAILLPQCEINDAKANAERIRLSLEKMIIDLPSNKSISITASFGVTSLQKEQTASDFYNCADKNLYEAKEKGRNCVVS